MIMKIPPEVDLILRKLTVQGYEAYAVGGCVRDSLLGKKPHDWDVTTSARPEETEAVFRNLRTIETGLKHGTVTVLSGETPVEVTTYRIDGTYSDGRHPDSVCFTGNLRDDLARRDFTVNTLACGSDGTITDIFGGQDDLKAGIIRCVGDANTRFREDGLRILRALRFASVLGFTIEDKTAESAVRNRALLGKIAKERIHEEFVKLLCGKDAAQVLRKYRDIIAEFIPELHPCFDFQQHNPHHIYDVWEHTLHSLEATDPDPILRLAVLLHDVGKPQCFTLGKDGIGHFYGHSERSAVLAQSIFSRLRFDRKTSDTAVKLIRSHGIPLWPDERCLRRRLNKIGEKDLRLLIKVEEADAAGKAPSEERDHYLASLHEIPAMLDRIMAQRQCFCLQDLAVSGDELIRAGIPKGPEVGRILKVLLGAVLDGKCRNTSEDLLILARAEKEGISL